MSELVSMLGKKDVLRLLIKHGTDFEVEKPAVFACGYASDPKPRLYASSGASLRRQINSGDFTVEKPRAGSNRGG